MDIQEALNWTDELVFAKTGKYLDSLQRVILEGTWKRQEYKEIAEDYHCTTDHVRKTAWELWKLLSDVLEENVKKSNVRAIVEKAKFSNISTFGSDYVQLDGDINFCNEHCPYPKTFKTRSQFTTSIQKPDPLHDLTEAPEPFPLNNRNKELATLKHWILEEKIRIVTIFGLQGIGKTTLARELVEQIKGNFDFILWRNCTNTLTLQSLENHLIHLFSHNSETKLGSLIDALRSHSSLIILDDFQELFASGEFAGTYLPECNDRDKFWQQIARSPHNSCFLLLSWENPSEIACLEGENCHCRTFQLGGLGESATEILSAKGLRDREKWGELIQRYEGNPSWLNIIASTIQDVFHGSVDRFLSYPTLVIGDLEPRLQAFYQRLSESEKIVMQGFAHQEAADIFHKPADLALSDTDFLKAVQSLMKRGLIQKNSDRNSCFFCVQGLFKAYLQNP